MMTRTDTYKKPYSMIDLVLRDKVQHLFTTKAALLSGARADKRYFILIIMFIFETHI